jgi:hypothetical protein
MDEESDNKGQLDDEMRKIIEEARVILPGVQALFGFQTIAVFSERFDQLPAFAKACHLAGLGMVVIAVGLVVTPAVYYRVVEPCNVSARMLRISSWLIRWALAPLACGLALEMFTVIHMVGQHLGASVAGALLTLLALGGMWLVFPWLERRKCERGGR